MLINIDGGVAANLLATLYVYLGSPVAANLVDGTDIGGFNVSEVPNPIVMESGHYLTFVWAAGTPAAEATGTVEGTIEETVRA